MARRPQPRRGVMVDSGAQRWTRNIDRVLADPAVSFPLKSVLRQWLLRDCLDAAGDARVLVLLLEAGAVEALEDAL